MTEYKNLPQVLKRGVRFKIMHIHSLIFKELLKRGYSLEGNTRVWNIADSKLWYITSEQAQAYLDLVSSDNYKKEISPKENDLIQKNYPEIFSIIKGDSVNIIDLGCGNGKKAAYLIDKMRDRKKIRYFPIDISGYMVQKAIENVRKLDIAEIVGVGWNISDFENLQNISKLFNKREFKDNLFLLLGNTLGNFEIHELLYEVRASMHEGDYLLIGNGLNNDKVEEDIVKACRQNKGFDKLFTYIPLLIGLKKEDVSFDVRFRNSRVEFFHTLLKEKEVIFQNKKIHFDKGDQIIVGVAYHYRKEELLAYLKMYFGYSKIFISNDGSYSLVLCRK